MRSIDQIIVHCSATREGQHVTVQQIRQWHLQRKFADIGYHYVVRRNGEIEPGRPEWLIGAHCVNHNAHSIGICYEGGLDIRGQPADTRTAEQKQTMRRLLEQLHERYPRAMIVGHHDLYPPKDCPCFDAAKEYADMQQMKYNGRGINPKDVFNSLSNISYSRLMSSVSPGTIKSNRELRSIWRRKRKPSPLPSEAPSIIPGISAITNDLPSR